MIEPSSPGAADGTPPLAGAPVGVRVTPLARRLAAEHGLDLTAITGTGIGGRITRRDVAAQLATGNHDAPVTAAAADVFPPATAPPPAPSPARAAAAPAERRRPAAGLGVPAADQAPTAWLLVEVDLTALLARLSALGQAGSNRPRLTACVLRAAALALREQPLLNAVWAGDAIRLYGRITIELARHGRPDDTSVIIPLADRLSLDELAAGIEGDWVAPAVPTFTLIDIPSSDASMLARRPLPPGQAACLVVGPPVRRLVATDDDRLAYRSIAGLALIFDHRLVDGAPAGRFLQTVRRWLEDEAPAALAERRPDHTGR